ncbi:MAG: WGR domain-containing protein [Pseudomonadota bacterium]
MPDLFGGVSLLREWGRIGTQGGIGSSSSKMRGARPTQWSCSIEPSGSGDIGIQVEPLPFGASALPVWL